MSHSHLTDWIITAAVIAGGAAAVLLSFLWRHVSNDMEKKDDRKPRRKKSA